MATSGGFISLTKRAACFAVSLGNQTTALCIDAGLSCDVTAQRFKNLYKSYCMSQFLRHNLMSF